MRSSSGGAIAPSRLLMADALRVGATGLRARRLRAALSALGIAIGIASMVAVLGITAARRLGIHRPGVNVWLGDHWFTVIGILGRVTLDPNLDSAALVGYPAAKRLFGADRSATTIYVRAAE